MLLSLKTEYYTERKLKNAKKIFFKNHKKTDYHTFFLLSLSPSERCSLKQLILSNLYTQTYKYEKWTEVASCATCK